MGIGLSSGDNFVLKHFSHDKDIIDTYFALRNPGLKTDLLRYLILWIEGGVYSDLDTWAFKPVDDWVPEHIKAGGQQVGAVVGIEWDQLGGDPWPAFDNGPSDLTHEVQFCQWTLGGAAGHPLFKNAALMSVERIKALAADRQESITDLDPTGHEVVTTTGPSAWTNIVFEELRKADPTFTDLNQLSNLKQPKLIGDILILTIDGFGMGQPHSQSTADGSIPDAALVKHGFSGTWAKDRPHSRTNRQ